MTADDKKLLLAGNRIKQALESIDEAEFLISGGKSPRSIINRVYYSMFYALLALLVFEDFSSSKHSGVISYFNKNFIKSGKFPEDPGKYLNITFELRMRSDYRENVDLTIDQIKPYIQHASSFIEIVEDIIMKK